MLHIVEFEEVANELQKDIKVRQKAITDDEQLIQGHKADFDIEKDIVLEYLDWTLDIRPDLATNSLVFQAVIAPNRWLAIGLQNSNLLDKDIIQWINPASQLSQISCKDNCKNAVYTAVLKDETLFDHQESNLRNEIQRHGDKPDQMEFTTWMPLEEANLGK